MTRMTKAQLVEENESLKLRVAFLTNALEQTQQSVPAAPKTQRVAITADNPAFEGLPMYPPHSKIECGVHGRGTANKAGFCMLCACERVRGGRAAA